MDEMNRLNTLEDFKELKRGDEIIVVWNQEGEIWDKRMKGRKLYKILWLQKANPKSEYPDEIILGKAGNIFFNFRLFLNGESKIVKEVYALRYKEPKIKVPKKVTFKRRDGSKVTLYAKRLNNGEKRE